MCACHTDATPTRISCVARNSNQDRRQMKEATTKTIYEKLKFVRTRQKWQRRIGHHFCNVDHRKHCTPYASQSVVGNKISQCAESLCNMSTWHHENAIPDGEHKIVGSRTTLWRSIRCTPFALTLVVSASPTHSLAHTVCIFSLRLPTRSPDHIERLILFEFCVYSVRQYMRTRSNANALAARFYLFIC